MFIIESLQPTVADGPRTSTDDVLELRLGRSGGGADGAAAAARSPDEYVVRPGDTLSAIARDELGSAALADQLARINGLDDSDALLPGQVIRLR